MSYYDYAVDIKENAWVPWEKLTPELKIPNLAFEELIIPTEESTKYLTVNKTLLNCHMHVINCGDTGTGKTITCEALINTYPALR